jgi:uncharacterized protein (DUF488 family)
MTERVFTIGVYGKTEDQFFKKLTDARIDTFCDIRQRRGVRGSQYAFVNSKRLQRVLKDLGIAYWHLPELAPTKEIRAAQYALDQKLGVGKRSREELGDEFKRRYANEILGALNSESLRQKLGSEAKSVAFFCVEAAPGACHRSLVAERLKRDWNVPVEHL